MPRPKILRYDSMASVRAIPSAVRLNSGLLAAVIRGGVRSLPPGVGAPNRMGAGPVVARYPTCL
jgi:hypothetical protein